jgi:chromatin structure-remodeling complex subunit RSC1/2
MLLYSGHDPSRLFHRSVNKRVVPDYYDIIKDPMALSILKQRINKREYKQFSDFVRDCALVRELRPSLPSPSLTVPF